MKKKQRRQADERVPAFDFSKAKRNRFAARLKNEGYTVRIYEADGTFTERHVLKESAVVLEPEVQKYFPDSKSVNEALRKVISLFPKDEPPSPKRRLTAKGKGARKRN